MDKLIYIIALAVTFFSCQEKDNKGGMEMIIEDPAELATITDVVKVRDTQHNNDEISIKNEFESIEYVRLDNKKIIDRILRIVLTKDYMFLYLSHDGGVMKYDRKGNFIKQIARLGEGPSEVNPHDIVVDELREKVYIAQFSRKHSIAVFSFEGEFLGCLEYPFDNISFMLPLGDELFFNFYEVGIPLSNPLNYGSGIFDIIGKKYYSRKSYVKQCDSTNCLVKWFSYFPIKNGYLYKIGGNNILYKCTKEGINPVYYLELKNPIRGEIYQLSYSPQFYTNFSEEHCNSYIFIRRDQYFETDSCLYLKYSNERKSYVVQYDKNKNITRSYEPKIKRVLGIENDIDRGAPIWPTYYYKKENIYVQTLSGGAIQDLKDLDYLDENAPAIYRDMNADSNPLVIIYKCK